MYAMIKELNVYIALCMYEKTIMNIEGAVYFHLSERTLNINSKFLTVVVLNFFLKFFCAHQRQSKPRSGSKRPWC